MNERIDELAHGCYEYIEGTLDGDIIEFDYKKFAELIVAECVQVAHPKLRDVGEWAAGMRLAQKRIKEHFGVEL